MPAQGRPYDVEVGLRIRGVSLPSKILDKWYRDQDDADWAWIDGRPRIRGHTLGLEYNLVGPHHNGLFYAEFTDADFRAGYWDDVDVGASDPLDGNWVAPSAGTGVVGIGGDYAYEGLLVKPSDTGGRFGLGLLVGAGLGMGVLVGNLDTWGPDDEGNPSYQRYLDGLPPDEDKDLPRVYPLVDVNTGVRMTFGERVSWRLEGGLHTLLYYGTSVTVRY